MPGNQGHFKEIFNKVPNYSSARMRTKVEIKIRKNVIHNSLWRRKTFQDITSKTKLCQGVGGIKMSSLETENIKLLSK